MFHNIFFNYFMNIWCTVNYQHVQIILSLDTVSTTLILKIKYIIWQLRVKSQLLFQD